jgi:transposase InsO family protein
MIQDYKEHMPIARIARKYRTSRTTVYRWIHRYLMDGKDGLLDNSHKPKSPHPDTLKPDVVEAIIRMRKRTNYGPRRLKFYLAKKKIRVSEYGIYKTLVRNDLIRRYRKHKHRHKKYYAPYPGHTVQIDTKHLDTLPGYPYRFYQYTATDAFTRMRVIRIHDELSSLRATAFLKEVVKSLPFRVETVRTDNGVEFTYGPFKVNHPFSLECARLNIRHHLNKPAHPESNGRVERSHRTDDEEFYRVNPVNNPKIWQLRVPSWEYRYNYQRPHSALRDLTPYQFYQQYLRKKASENVT